MNIIPAKTTDESVLHLFSEHDDYMIAFLDDDKNITHAILRMSTSKMYGW